MITHTVNCLPGVLGFILLFLTQDSYNEIYLINKCYVHNIFMIFLQKILSDKLLLVVISGQKSNLSNGFKLKLIIYYHL